MSHPNLYRDDPFRPVDWRAERVISLLEHEGGPKHARRGRDDLLTRRYRSFLYRWRNCDDLEERRRVYPAYPDLYHAQRMRENNSEETQAVVEARILSGSSNDEISFNLGTSSAVVRAYEGLFFNVRDRLDRVDYIRDMVLAPALRDAASYDDRDVLTSGKLQAIYRVMGYVGGPKVLDFILFGFQRVARPTKISQLNDWLDGSYNNLLRQKGILAVQSFDFNKYTVMELLTLCGGVVKAADDVKRGGGAATDYQANVQAFIDTVQIGVGRRAEKAAAPATIHLEAGAVDPQMEDYYAVVDGRDAEDFKRFEGFGRPEPQPKDD